MNQQPMNQSPMTPLRPAVSKWVWIALVIAILGAIIFFVWYYVMGPGKKVETAPAPVATTTDETASWKTYSNASYNYTIKYPTTWSFAQATTGEAAADTVKNAMINFTLSSATKLTISAVAKTKYTGVTLTQFATDYVTPKDKATISGKTATKIGSLNGYQELVKITDPASDGIWYFAENTDYFFAFVSKESTQSANIKSMLSTFKLITTTAPAAAASSTDSKIYRNTEYSFSFSYPATFSVKESAIALVDSMGTSCQTITLNSKSSILACNKTDELTASGLREPDGMEPTTTTDMTIGGQPAKKYVNSSSASYVVLSPGSNRIQLTTSDVTSQNLTVLETLLGTFAFIK